MTKTYKYNPKAINTSGHIIIETHSHNNVEIWSAKDDKDLISKVTKKVTACGDSVSDLGLVTTEDFLDYLTHDVLHTEFLDYEDMEPEGFDNSHSTGQLVNEAAVSLGWLLITEV